MSAHEYTVEFRIQSKSMTMSHITAELGLEPSRCQEVGEQGVRGILEEGIWDFDGGRGCTTWASLEEGLTFVLNKLWKHREAIGEYKQDADIFWWCGSFQSSFDRGPSFSPELMRKLGKFGAKLYIETYISPGEEESGLKYAPADPNYCY